MVMDTTKSFAYMLSELSGEFFVFKHLANKFDHLQKISFVPHAYQVNLVRPPSECTPMTDSYKHQNRGSDSIAISKIDSTLKMLSLIAQCGLKGKPHGILMWIHPVIG
jgi:6-phosphogluconolactonase (cycloisomerase 2 family)